MKIDREDMLEITRRLTPTRCNLSRIAGAYMNEEGYIDNSFNINFLKLKGKELEHCLEIAKTIPFGETNEELIGLKIPGMLPGSIWQLLYALRDCELKNDALLMALYEMIGENYPVGTPYAIYVFYGAYDVQIKGKDKELLGESEEVYAYLIVAICPMSGDYEAGLPEYGFLYPAFSNRSTDIEHVNIYTRKGFDDELMPAMMGLQIMEKYVLELGVVNSINSELYQLGDDYGSRHYEKSYVFGT